MIRKTIVLIVLCVSMSVFSKTEFAQTENDVMETEVVVSMLPPSPLVVTPVSANEKLNVTDSWMESMRRALPEVLLRYKDDIEEASRTFGYDPRFLAGVLIAESSGDPNAVSHAGARGCMQTTRAADTDIGMEQLDSSDCHISIVKGAKYLAYIRDEEGFENPFAAVIAYKDGYGNASEYSMERILRSHYVHKIKAIMREIPPGTFS